MAHQNKKTLGEGIYLRLVDQDGWEHCERKKGSGVVAVVPVTDRGGVILIEQYRHALDANVIEIPAGLVGDDLGSEDEALIEAAKRELHEETGYEADDWAFATDGPSSAGMSTEHVTVYLARGLRKTGDGGGVENEAITVHDVSIDEAEAWLQQKRQSGAHIDLKVYLALYFAQCTT